MYIIFTCWSRFRDMYAEQLEQQSFFEDFSSFEVEYNRAVKLVGK